MEADSNRPMFWKTENGANLIKLLRCGKNEFYGKINEVIKSMI